MRSRGPGLRALTAAALALATQARAVQCELPGARQEAVAAAADAEADNPTQQRLQQRYSLAASRCNPALLQPSAPHEAQQLRLYDAQARPAPALGEGPAPSGLVAPSPAVASRSVATTRTAAAAPARPAARGNAPATVQRIRALVPTVADAARRHDIDPLLLHAVAHVESRHNAQATSHAGARGVMQVMPATGRRFGVADPLRQLHDPDINVHVGAEYLKVLQQRFGNNLPLVLAAYNAGEGSVEKYGRRVPPYPETQAYVREVLATYQRLRQTVAGSASGRAAP
jgi:soluble lytic murein transglycosylase-like protein